MIGSRASTSPARPAGAVNGAPLRVATVITRMEGGSGVLALRGAQSLDPAAVRPVIVTGSGGRLLDEAAASGIEVVVEPCLREVIAPRSDLRALRRLERLFRERAFDVVRGRQRHGARRHRQAGGGRCMVGDRLREQVLRELGWHIHRIWSTDWVKDPQRETARVMEALDKARNRVVPSSAAGSSRVPVRVESADRELQAERPSNAAVPPPSSPSAAHSDQTGSLTISRPYTSADVRIRGDLTDFQLTRLEELAKLIEAIVEVT